MTDETLSKVEFTEAFGTPDRDLQNHLLNQVIQTFRGSVSTEGFNYDRLEELSNNAMALLNGIQPQDEIEGMLAVQMVAVHNMAVETIRRAMITDQTFEGTVANVNHATKMLRTFAAQMEALKRYRTGGQQKVTVEHVHVGEGGQAIVGAVSTGGGVIVESESEPRVIRRGWLKNNNPPGDPNSALRCGAKTRKGTPCRGPAMKNGRCRMHGGKSTGPRTPEGLERSRKANWKHGYYSAESKATRRLIRWLARESRALIEKM